MTSNLNNKTNFITISGLALKYELSTVDQLNTRNCSSYLEWIEEIDVMPFDKGTIRFSDDCWKFGDYSNLNISKSNFTFNFSNCPPTYKRLLKQYTLIKIIENKIKLQSIYGHLVILKTFVNYLSRFGIHTLKDVKLCHLQSYFKYISESKISLAQIHRYRNIIYSLYIFYELNIDNILNEELEDFLAFKDIKNQDSYKIAHRALEIPNDYYDKLLSALVIFMNDASNSIWYRATAALYIILSQTGLRASELIFSKKGCVSESTLFTGEKAFYFNYETWKGSRGNNTRTSAFTYMNELSKKAYDFLADLPEYNERRETWNVNFLYCGSKTTELINLPITSRILVLHAVKLFAELDRKRLLKTINLNKEDYPYLHVYKTTPHLRKQGILTVSFPTTQQFRFHVCTELFNKGVALTYIQRFMSHLSSLITTYHIYTENKVQEDMDEAKRVLRGIITGEEKIIEQDKGLKTRIDEFIKANNFNVEKDLETIVSKLAENIPIRVKVCGVCIKSSRFRDCSTDAITNEFFCCYGVCPNLFHFFYHAGITFRKCKELKEALDINQKRGLLKQVYKDTNNLKNIITTQLLPQMDELENQIKKHGAVYVSQTYPDLIEVIENFNTIKEEAQKWVNTTQQI